MNDFSKMAFVPYDKLDELLQKVENINAQLSNKRVNQKGLDDFVTEDEAKNLLGKGTTWFWNKRKSGELTGRKAGNKWYYKREEIINFISGDVE